MADGSEPISVGFASVGAALKEALHSAQYDVIEGDSDPSHGTIRVFERNIGAVQMAYACEWSAYFREWTLMRVPDEGPFARRPERGAIAHRVGNCVEGIRVDLNSPGFAGTPLVALANAIGHDAPKTTVARLGLERSPEHTEMLRSIYRCYLDHIEKETRALFEERGFAVGWAARTAALMVGQVLHAEDGQEELSARISDLHVLTEILESLPLYAVDEGAQRRLVSASELGQHDSFLTIDSDLVRAANVFLMYSPGASGVAELQLASAGQIIEVPDAPVVHVMPTDEILSQLVLGTREITRVDVDRPRRRIDLTWTTRTEAPRWHEIHADRRPAVLSEIAGTDASDEEFLFQMDTRFPHRRRFGSILVPPADLPVSGLSREIGVRTRGLEILCGSDPSPR